jgi:hypothetical protein
VQEDALARQSTIAWYSSRLEADLDEAPSRQLCVQELRLNPLELELVVTPPLHLKMFSQAS